DELMPRMGDPLNSAVVRLLRQVILNLQGRSSQVSRLTGPDFHEDDERVASARNLMLASHLDIFARMVRYLAGDYAGAVALAGEDKVVGNRGCMLEVHHTFYGALARVAHLRGERLFSTDMGDTRAASTDRADADKERAAIARALTRLEDWAGFCPANHAHRAALVRAELAQLDGRPHEAFEQYELAIDSAARHGFVQDVGLAYELAALFYERRGRRRLARSYCHEACTAYAHWGATALIKRLQGRYPDIVATADGPPLTSLVAPAYSSTTPRTGHDPFDVQSVLKASQALSSEIVLDELLNRMMAIMLEAAGAERGALALTQDEVLVIENEVDVNRDPDRSDRSLRLESVARLPHALMRYVMDTGEPYILGTSSPFADPYLEHSAPQSLLCIPIIHQGRPIGVLYLENNLVGNAFPPQRCELLATLSTQAAIAIHNARLYGQLEERVAERTRELQQAKDAAEAATH
ncbi:MAG: GAF domain-containing protein, partial [Myxococcota bacterium]